MSPLFSSCPAGSPLPEEVISLIAHHLADLGASRTTVSAMTASRALHALFLRHLRCAKLTLDEANSHCYLKGLEKPLKVRSAADKASLWSKNHKTRSPNFTFRYHPHRAWRLSARKDRKRRSKSPSRKTRLKHAEILSHCEHLMIDDLKSAEAVIQASESAKALGQEGLWANVETVCLGPALLGRLGYLDGAALDLLDRIPEVIWPKHLCVTFGTASAVPSNPTTAENRGWPIDISWRANRATRWDLESFHSSTRALEMLIGAWAPARVSVHNVSTQRLPYVGAPSVRIFWATADAHANTVDRGFREWRTEYNERARDIARMLSCLSEAGEQVEFCGLACLECLENQREKCTRDLEKAVLGFVEPPQFRSKVKDFVRYTTNPSPCEACGKC